jgi:hypothetical protein
MAGGCSPSAVVDEPFQACSTRRLKRADAPLAQERDGCRASQPRLDAPWRKPRPSAPAACCRSLRPCPPAEAWQPCRWRAANGKAQHTRLAWQEVFLARGFKEPQGQLEKCWLVVDWPQDAPEPYHCYLAHFHRAPSKARCLRLSRSRWHVEQYFQRSKDDLGLDHYEGRSWQGFHHHLVLAALAYLFILTIYLA